MTIDINEQATGAYWATLKDESNVLIPGNVLSSLTLTLYATTAIGNFVIVNGRNKQSVLNVNDVVVYNTLQTRPDGKTYNFLWQIRREDTILTDMSLAIERHVGLFEWSWPNNKYGKQEVTLAVRNLTFVP